jgi:hypothetical protein
MAGPKHLDTHFGGALHDRVEIIHFEPKQQPIAVGPVGAIADGTVMVLGFKAVQLQNEGAVLYQLLIFCAAVSAAAAQQMLIPAAAGFDVGHTDERLRAHGCKSIKTAAWVSNIQTEAALKLGGPGTVQNPSPLTASPTRRILIADKRQEL